MTGHEDPAKPESALDWGALAAFPGTLVVYMGVRQLEAIAERLIAGGRDLAEPAAVIERGTLATSAWSPGRSRRSPRRRGQGIRAPAIAVIGPVVALQRAPRAGSSGRPLAGMHGRGHAGAGAGERARGAAARARGGGGRGAGDQDRADRRARRPTLDTTTSSA